MLSTRVTLSLLALVLLSTVAPASATAGPAASGQLLVGFEQGASADRQQEILSALKGRPAAVQATLYYQAIPPFYLQDRFCTAQGQDTQRLYFLAGHLNLTGTQAESWKLQVVSTGSVALSP